MTSSKAERQKGTGTTGLTVAVTGPTGEIGISTVDALERDPAVGRIIGMARRPFDPASHGWRKTTYQQGDILDREAVDALVRDADVVVHLAFIVLGTREESQRVNVAGTRNVFEATVAADRLRSRAAGDIGPRSRAAGDIGPRSRAAGDVGHRRLVYTSSVAAYGYHSDNPIPLTEDTPVRGSAEHYYSEQKAECEKVLAETTEGSALEVFVLRPCIVAGPKATALADAMPWRALPDAVQSVTKAVPLLKPPFPDPGTPLQLIHHDDVAAAIALAASTKAPPGVYNIAGDGEVSLSEVATALGARPVRVPAATAKIASAVIARVPFLPSATEWLHATRTSVVMDIGKAKSVLGWTPRYTSAETLQALATSL